MAANANIDQKTLGTSLTMWGAYQQLLGATVGANATHGLANQYAYDVNSGGVDTNNSNFMFLQKQMTSAVHDVIGDQIQLASQSLEAGANYLDTIANPTDFTKLMASWGHLAAKCAGAATLTLPNMTSATSKAGAGSFNLMQTLQSTPQWAHFNAASGGRRAISGSINATDIQRLNRLGTVINTAFTNGDFISGSLGSVSSQEVQSLIAG